MNPFRGLPSVNQVLDAPTLADCVANYPREVVVNAVREVLDEIRRQLARNPQSNGPTTTDSIVARVTSKLRHLDEPLFRPVVNATGILLHTNLGRAPMSEAAARAAANAGRGYLNLEIDLETGKRSSRQRPIRNWLTRLTGCESATVVNNCAAATVIALRALAAGREVIVSRGQLVEIGGSFRVPEVMAVSGAVLKEVGTTNITRISDYEAAIGSNTAVLMHVHTSNYRITGHTFTPSVADLVALGRKRNLTVIDDTGSGAMVGFSRFGFPHQPGVRESIQIGADLVLFSGDKLLGGPQAGIILGRKPLIQLIERDPLMRAFRVDKMTLAALEVTLRSYLDEGRANQEIPFLRMLGETIDSLRQRAESLANRLREFPELGEVRVRKMESFVGGGSLPEHPIPAVVVAMDPATIPVSDLAARLRTGDPAVVGRIHRGKLLFDVRTVLPGQDNLILDAIRSALQPKGD
jgi:L-seryl-tRNA(Ser) seleniumtransferase